MATNKTTATAKTTKADKTSNIKVADERIAATDEPVAPLIEAEDVPNMTKSDINDATANGLNEDTGPKRDAAEGLAQESDKVHGKLGEKPEPNPFSQGPGSDIA